MIESVNNDKVKYWTKLNEKKYQEQEGKFLVEGEHLVEEAYKSDNLLEVIVLEGYDFPYKNRTIVNNTVMKKITSLDNCPPIIGVAKKLKAKPIKGRVLLLDRVSNPGNLGTILRSSVAFGIDTVVLGTGCVSIYNPKVVRATEGLMFHLNIIESGLPKIIAELKTEDYKIYTTDVLNGRDVTSFEFPIKVGVIIGNEGAGVSAEIKNLCDDFICIKMQKECESLNVGVATSIILYEMYKK